MILDTDVLVVGAGPAGIGAALGARERGLNVVVLDEAPAPGGQIYRAPFGGAAGLGAVERDVEAATGDKLRRQLAQSGAHVVSNARIWSAAAGSCTDAARFRLDALAQGNPSNAEPRMAHAGSTCLEVHARRVIAATGTTERLVPFPGWTTPGVYGLGATTAMLKSHFIVPGQRTVVAGAGPLLAAVAAGLVKAGAPPLAVVDLASPREWLARLPRLLWRPELVRRGLHWLQLVRKAGVPVLFRHTVVGVGGVDAVAWVDVQAVDANGHRRTDKRLHRFAADALAVGHGLTPATEFTRLLMARHVFERARGGWIAQHDESFRTSVPGLYVAGDGAGVYGAAAALLQGRIAGRAAALDHGGTPSRLDSRETRGALARAVSFGAAMTSLCAPRPGLLADIAPDTVVCRCEEVNRAAIDKAMRDGAREVNQVKAWTRCGMGPCQGRLCAETVAELVASQVGSRERAGAWTARAPLRPVCINDLVGDYAYADIPMPEPAPA